jgi:hypothetical protein
MRGIAMPYVLVAAVLLGNAAVAQNNPDQPPPRSSGGAQTNGQADDSWGRTSSGREAPIGHRQPRAKDVPSAAEDNLGVLSPEDEAIDRKLRICRDC